MDLGYIFTFHFFENILKNETKGKKRFFKKCKQKVLCTDVFSFTNANHNNQINMKIELKNSKSFEFSYSEWELWIN